jgi:hypothetical protein
MKVAYLLADIFPIELVFLSHLKITKYTQILLVYYLNVWNF